LLQADKNVSFHALHIVFALCNTDHRRFVGARFSAHVTDEIMELQATINAIENETTLTESRRSNQQRSANRLLQNYIKSVQAVHDASTQRNDDYEPNEEQYDSEEWDSDDDDCT